MPRSSRGYENDSGGACMAEVPPAAPRPGPAPALPPLLFSSLELVSPATLASMPSASEGFCRLLKGSSSVLDESEPAAWGLSPYCCCCCCCCAPASCDHVPRLPSAWKLPSSGPVGVSEGRPGVVSSRRFLRTRRPPRLLPPSTHSRLSRLHRRHGMVPCSSLHTGCQYVELAQDAAGTHSRHRLFRLRQFRQAWWARLALDESSSFVLDCCCASGTGCCGEVRSIPHR